MPPYRTMGALRVGKLCKFLDQAGHDIRVLSCADLPYSKSVPLEISEERVIQSDTGRTDADEGFQRKLLSPSRRCPCIDRVRWTTPWGPIRRPLGRRTADYVLGRDCRPLAFLLTGGKVADCTAAGALLEQMLAIPILHGDKGYDSNAVRQKIEAMGAAPNIPPKANRRWKNCFSPVLYRDRNAIERMFGRIKDFRRIATRYDRLAAHFLSAVCLVATICYWL